jgi:hypothetical protein
MTRPNLHREAEPIVVSTTLRNKLAIFVVQVKIAGELLWRGPADVASQALVLCRKDHNFAVFDS